MAKGQPKRIGSAAWVAAGAINNSAKANVAESLQNLVFMARSPFL